MGVEPEVEIRVADGSVNKTAPKIFENIHLESESSLERTNNNIVVIFVQTRCGNLLTQQSKSLQGRGKIDRINA
jgi:hypothetical protein